MSETRMRSAAWTVALVGLAVTATGCAGLRTAVPDWFGRDVPEASASNPVVRIVSVWQAAEGTGQNGVPTRGFAGQIMFFARNSEAPVKVNGDVRIYVFDDQGTPEEQAKPIHQFDFLGDGWTAQMYESTFGPTYQVFLPYTRKGNHAARCGLRVRLTPEEGPPVFSDVVHVNLEGEQPENDGTPAEPVVHRQGALGVQTKTIPLVDTTPTRIGRSSNEADNPRGAAKPDTVQQTSATVSSAPHVDDRLERLERMFSQVLEQQPAADGSQSAKSPRRTALEGTKRRHPLDRTWPGRRGDAMDSATGRSDAPPRRYRLGRRPEGPTHDDAASASAVSLDGPGAAHPLLRDEPASEPTPFSQPDEPAGLSPAGAVHLEPID